MIAMEFEEMQKIWDGQNNRVLYAIDESSLHKRIRSKMNQARKGSDISEWSLVIIYLTTAGVLFGMNRFNDRMNIFLFFAAAWMIGMVIYILVNHFKKIKASRQFDRSVQGDLGNAITLTGYQIRLSRMLLLNLLPLGIFLISSGWESGKLLKTATIIVVSHALSFFVMNEGYQANKRKKRELLVLKEKLETEL